MYIYILAVVSLQLTLAYGHELTIDCYKEFEKDGHRIQQQILWLHASLLSWQQSRRQIQTSQKCIDFYKKLIENRMTMMKHKGGKVPIIHV